jgi:hypothetical protein
MFAGYLWLMPVMLATQAAAIQRITVQGHPRQKSRTYLLKIPNTEKGLVCGPEFNLWYCQQKKGKEMLHLDHKTQIN